MEIKHTVNMKTKLLFVTVILLSISTSMFSQHRRGSQVRFKDSGKSEKEVMKDAYARKDNPERLIEIGATYNYQFGGRFYAYDFGSYKEVKVSDSDSYGITVSFPSKYNPRVELGFFNQETTISGGRYGREDVAIRYYQIGIVKEMPKGNMIPYGTFSMGAVELNPKENNYSDAWKFAMTLGGGLKYYFTKNIGLKIEGRMMVPIAYGGLYIGTGGSGASVSSTTLQGYIGGGATFALTR